MRGGNRAAGEAAGYADGMKSGLPVGIDVLLDPTRTEGLRVEYKADWNHLSGGQALRTMCAFANDLVSQNGGYVVFGVEEDDGHPVRPVRGIAASTLDQVQKELHGATMRIEPRYSPMVVVEPVDGTSVVVAWCPAGDARPYQAPETLAKAAPKHHWVRTSSVTQEAKGETLRRLLDASTRTPFDDRGAFDASLDDLSPALLQEHLAQARSRLAGERLGVAALCRHLNLSRTPNGHDVPRNVALLFFADEPTRWFPGARIELTTLPEGRTGPIHRQTFGGPLPAQVRSVLDYLRGQVIERIQKVPDRAEAERVYAWPFAAVEEAVVNAVHHRGYESPEPVKIEVLPDQIRIASYPGPVDGVTQRALDTGDFPAIPSRNRRIAELLREVRLAEAARTGVALIQRSMQENGSPPPVFRFDEARTYFEVVLPIHPALRPRGGGAVLPIRIGRASPPAEVVGREDLVARVWRVLERQSVALRGPRGRGVSSALGAIAAQAPDGAPVIELDVAGVTLRGVWAAVATWLEENRFPVAGDSLTDLLRPIRDRGALLVLDGFGAGDLEFDDQGALEGAVLELTTTARVLVGERAGPHPLSPHAEAWDAAMWQEGLAPLSEAASVELAQRLLAGAPTLDANAAHGVAALSGGNPGVIHHVVHRLIVDPTTSPEAAFDELLVQRGDPTGLAARIRRIGELLRTSRFRGSAFSQVELAVLTAVAGDPAGRPRLDLVAQVVSGGTGRLDALGALRDLSLAGWVNEVDGRVRFEHVLVRDAFLSARGAPPARDGNSADGDVPF